MQYIFKEAFSSSCASFIRITKGDYNEESPVIETNHFIRRQDNTDILVIAHGKMVRYCNDAFTTMPEFSLFAMDRIKPLDDEKLRVLFNGARPLVLDKPTYDYSRAVFYGNTRLRLSSGDDRHCCGIGNDSSGRIGGASIGITARLAADLGPDPHRDKIVLIYSRGHIELDPYVQKRQVRRRCGQARGLSHGIRRIGR